MPSLYTTPAPYALLLIDLMEGRGYDREYLLTGTSLSGSGLANVGARVSDDDFARLVSNALALGPTPGLGLDLGERLNLSAHAVLGQAFLTCSNLEEVLELFLKYYHLLAPRLQLDCTRKDDYCELTVHDSAFTESEEFSHELIFSAILNTLRGLVNRPDLQARVELPYPSPVHVERYQQTFGPQVSFNQWRGRIVMSNSILSINLPSSNPALRAMFENECARLLTDISEDSVVQQTLHLLRKLEGQYPQMPQIAQMLNLSSRTYRRRLLDEQKSFQELLDQVRSEHATRYLRETRMPLSTIAYRVGFNDASNFRRAFQKWTGRTPAEMRRHGP